MEDGGEVGDEAGATHSGRSTIGGNTGLRSGVPRGPAGAAGLQTLHTKLPYLPLV